jgi:GTP-binding protein
MEPFAIKNAQFVTSVGRGGNYPADLPHEIAIVGRSNVGKSSLINTIAHNAKLARISSVPGKTRLVNYFLINRSFYLVDLPGYGYAQRSKAEKEEWGALMEEYLSSGRPKHLFLLLDIRHDPSPEDRQMFSWILYYGVPYTLIATKADKIAKSKRKTAVAACAKALGAPPYAIPFSSLEKVGTEELLNQISQIVQDPAAEELGRLE